MWFLCIWGLHSYGSWVDESTGGIRSGFIGENGLQGIYQSRKCKHCGNIEYR